MSNEHPSPPATPRARDAAETGGNLRPASPADIDIARWVSERLERYIAEYDAAARAAKEAGV